MKMSAWEKYAAAVARVVKTEPNTKERSVALQEELSAHRAYINSPEFRAFLDESLNKKVSK